jgi:phosphoribosylamine--glycine ligase
LELFIATDKGKLNDAKIEFDKRACTTVVAASGGYPCDYKKNFEIDGFENLKGNDETIVFHAGTKKVNNVIVTNGGRVLAVTSFGKDIPDAMNKSKKVLEQIHFDGMYYRRDIGYEFM